jgi:PAS domain S-box-containing protein/putative nucleotidyltransferase with HDIG domain
VHRALREVRERTRRHLAEKALRASEQRYRMLVESSSDGILQFNRRGQLAFVNPRAANILGCDRAQLAAQPSIVKQLLHPSSWQQFLAVLEKFGESGVLPEQAAEWRWTRPDGVPVCTENLFTNLVNDRGLRIGFQIVLRDITDKRRAEVALRRSYKKLQHIFDQTVNTLSSVVGKCDPYTGAHQRRVAQLARRIAEEMKLPASRVEGIFLTCLLHDIGKINIPGEILNRSGPLTEAEALMIRTHPEVGYQILKNIEFPWPVAIATVQHHEHLNGSGYPSGLAGDQIILEARILTVADVIESMASHRPYRPALGIKRALQEVSQYSGIRYDPAVVECGRRLFEEGRFHFAPVDASDIWHSEALSSDEA